jgi:hypothetical protein
MRKHLTGYILPHNAYSRVPIKINDFVIGYLLFADTECIDIY